MSITIAVNYKLTSGIFGTLTETAFILEIAQIIFRSTEDAVIWLQSIHLAAEREHYSESCQ